MNIELSVFRQPKTFAKVLLGLASVVGAVACNTTPELIPNPDLSQVVVTPVKTETGTLLILKTDAFSTATKLQFSRCSDTEQQPSREALIELGSGSAELQPGFYCKPTITVDGRPITWEDSILYVTAGKKTTAAFGGSLEQGGLSLKNNDDIAEPTILETQSSQIRTYKPDNAALFARSYFDKPYANIDSTAYIYGFTDYSTGGNCTNFINIAINAGIANGITNSTPTPKYLWDNRTFFSDRAGSYVRYFEFDGAPPAGRSASWAGADFMKRYASAQNNTAYEGVNFDYVTNDSLTTALDVGKIRMGDIIFADWEGTTAEFDHSMIVTGLTAFAGNDRILVSYQNSSGNAPRLNRSLGDINRKYNYRAVFWVYRPLGLSR